ncbi:hypothetical protein [Brachybacterium sacelli]|uniref:hypothetical protein n=1 Tax=Brachybacterium sacelli TaxID=173364 RepID=UPI00361208FD
MVNTLTISRPVRRIRKSSARVVPHPDEDPCMRLAEPAHDRSDSRRGPARVSSHSALAGFSARCWKNRDHEGRVTVEHRHPVRRDPPR